MRPSRGVHPDAADPHRGEFVRRLLQEQVVEERGGAQEGRADEEANGGKHERQRSSHRGARAHAHQINNAFDGSYFS